ncbi:MAG: ribosome maturation factor RimM [Spirochaetota bacterium]
MDGFVAVGTVVRPQGVRGELKVTPYGSLDDIRFLANVRRIYLVRDERSNAYDVVSVKFLTDAAVIKVTGIDDMNAAGKLTGSTVSVGEGDFPPLPADSYHIDDLIGMTVVDEKGIVRGTVAGIIRTKAHDVLEVTGPERTVNIPFVKAIVTVDTAARRMTVRASGFFA